jgi:hypothetical protein
MADQEVWYVCECGCRVPQSGMTKIKKGPDFVFRCAEHLTRVHHREATCQWPGCTEIFHQSRSGYISEFCPEHRRQKAVKVAQEYRENHSDSSVRAINRAKRSMKLYDPTRWACVNRRECLDNHDGYACLPCKGCARYQLPDGYDLPVDRDDEVAA